MMLSKSSNFHRKRYTIRHSLVLQMTDDRVHITFLDDITKAFVMLNGVKHLAWAQVRSFASAGPPAQDDEIGGFGHPES